MSDGILLADDGGVRVLTLNRPDKRNAIDTAMWIALRDAFREAAVDDTVRCVLLCGAGEHFCSGVDLASFGDSGSGEEHPFESAARAVVEFDKPLIAAAQGVAVGGGATVLFHADIVYIAESFRLRLPFASLGLVPEWGSSYMLQANIGAQRAAELFYTAEWVPADKALAYGLAAERLADADLFAHALRRAQEIARWPVNALREIKRSLRLHHLAAIDTAIGYEQGAMARQVGSAENIEAITAFLEKRPPDFSHC
ncbi:MAG: enoyl-CoA hydratase/isomerase family protein [Pseudomonadales bacterium]|nr:enoyl-CoA hydratase/isomerase family protein [Pseudomonadales bacterium]MCP5189885.1 enoyl-CoA hydratase/isomerase family protein [Pseudomonadales bacterium]MCP5203609.1 enoyl-CoA hydratase/isomerase family protein [Pseudomonadales bacterium]